MNCIHRGRFQRMKISGTWFDTHVCDKFGICTAEAPTEEQRTWPTFANAGICKGCPLFSGPSKPVPESVKFTPQSPEITPQLTIGMATYRDWPGVWATIQSLRLHHSEVMPWVQIVVIDNDPKGKPDEEGESNHSFKAKQLCNRIGATYEHFTTVHGTAAAKGRIFDLATAPNVLVMDCHVLLPTGAVSQLMDYFQNNRRNDLLHGPCIGDGGYDDLVGTHFNPAWGSLMFGQWGVDERGKDPTGEPFEIPMQGCGLFACTKNAWPGFHPALRGFGPEEWHIHQRIRRKGGRILCLPWLRWCHRFGNPDGTKPPGLHPEERLRGHLVTYLDTGGEEWLASMRKHFVEDTKRLTSERFDQVLLKTREEFDAYPKPELVGDTLHELIVECGINRPTCGQCDAWRQRMNDWGIDGCKANRTAILERLDQEAKGATWFEVAGVAAKGFLTTNMLLEEAFRRVRKGNKPTVVATKKCRTCG